MSALLSRLTFGLFRGGKQMHLCSTGLQMETPAAQLNLPPKQELQLGLVISRRRYFALSNDAFQVTGALLPALVGSLRVSFLSTKFFKTRLATAPEGHQLDGSVFRAQQELEAIVYFVWCCRLVAPRSFPSRLARPVNSICRQQPVALKLAAAHHRRSASTTRATQCL